MKNSALIGLDGAAWHLVDPLIDKGVMPNLAALRDRGAAGTLKSTVPTYTPPAWTSAATGVNPGRHGIYGFIEGHAQHEGLELVHSGKIKSPTIWQIANDQGARVGVYNLPLTYPPRELNGWMVSGMMTPGYGERLKGFAYPREVEAKILSWVPDYVLDISPNWETDYKDAALCGRIVDSLRQRLEVLKRLLDEERPDVLFAVLEAPDRLQHVYYRYMDPADELYGSEAGRTIRPEIERCFAAMDDIVGLVAERYDNVVSCSDHGFTAWDVSVHTNALLAQWGYLRVKPAARAMQTAAARALVPLAKRVLPAKAARQAKGKTFAAIDWTNTKAFASPIPQQGIYINVRGRDRFGVVPPEEVEALKDDLVRRFRELKGPDGNPVTDHVWKSQEVFHGDALDGAPDVLPVLRDHRFELDDEIFHKEPFTELRHLPRGVHHPNGIVVLAGDGISGAGKVEGTVADITPTLLYMAGLKVPEGLDGHVLTDAFAADHLDKQPIEVTAPLSSKSADEESPYSEEEEALIEESLRGLGYL
ncbi:MAG TPA: alkaline phosphatase family protein [Actinomycetota bacterium]|nr:alkaline phosphatase family protein [Actinomycetota bacterium]